MKTGSLSEDIVVDLSRKVIKSYYDNDRELILPFLSKEFMWIGTSDTNRAEDRADFCDVLKQIPSVPPVSISDEHYHLIYHERNVWILYGRLEATYALEGDALVHRHMRFTLVWRRTGDGLKLIHIHSSCSADPSLYRDPQTNDAKSPEDKPLMEHFEKILSLPTNTRKLAFKDLSGVHRYLLPEEVVYLEADLQRTIVYTKSGTFQVHGLISETERNMPDEFFRIHKSYLLNSNYVDNICRYKATLNDGTQLPIGRDRYMDFKRYLAKRSQNRS